MVNRSTTAFTVCIKGTKDTSRQTDSPLTNAVFTLERNMSSLITNETCSNMKLKVFTSGGSWRES